MNRTTIRLAAVLVALGIIAYLVLQRQGEQSRVAGEGELLVAIDSAAVQKVEIVSSNGAVTLEKRGVEWRVTMPVDDRADNANIGQLLQRASGLRVKSIISTRPDKHALFNVDSAGTRVTVTQTDMEPVTFIVGKNSSSFGETYVRGGNSDEVALVDGSFPWVFNRPVREWRDRTLLSLPRASITEIGFRYGDTTFALSFVDSVWKVGSAAANQSTVSGLLTSLSSLQCDDFLATVPAQRTMGQITVAGTTISFEYDAAARKYYAQTSSSPQWYILEPWRAEQLLKRRKDLL